MSPVDQFTYKTKLLFLVPIDVCKCLPWFYPNNYTVIPMCDMFGAKCFDIILSDETHYKKCTEHCMENCKSTSYVAHTSYVPINAAEICKQPLFIEIFTNFIDSSEWNSVFEAIPMGNSNFYFKNSPLDGNQLVSVNP